MRGSHVSDHVAGALTCCVAFAVTSTRTMHCLPPGRHVSFTLLHVWIAGGHVLRLRQPDVVIAVAIVIRGGRDGCCGLDVAHVAAPGRSADACASCALREHRAAALQPSGSPAAAGVHAQAAAAADAVDHPQRQPAEHRRKSSCHRGDLAWCGSHALILAHEARTTVVSHPAADKCLLCSLRCSLLFIATPQLSNRFIRPSLNVVLKGTASSPRAACMSRSAGRACSCGGWRQRPGHPGVTAPAGARVPRPREAAGGREQSQPPAADLPAWRCGFGPWHCVLFGRKW